MDKYLRINKTDLLDERLLRWTLEVAEVCCKQLIWSIMIEVVNSLAKNCRWYIFIKLWFLSLILEVKTCFRRA